VFFTVSAGNLHGPAYRLGEPIALLVQVAPRHGRSVVRVDQLRGHVAPLRYCVAKVRPLLCKPYGRNVEQVSAARPFGAHGMLAHIQRRQQLALVFEAGDFSPVDPDKAAVLQFEGGV
jgi:hypothetical protein